MVHARQHSGGNFISISKDHTIFSSCGFPQSNMYQTGPGVGGGVWALDSQSYNGSIRSMSREEQHRRWLAQSDSNYRSRDRRSDCRSLPPPVHSVQPSHPDLFQQGFIGSPDLDRPQSFPTQYSRSSSEIQQPLSNWDNNNWDVDVDSHSSINQLPRYEDTNWNTPLAVQIPQLEHPSFDNMMFSASDSSSSTTLYTPPPEQSIPLNGFTFPHRISPMPSPTPSPELFEEDIKPIITNIPTSRPRAPSRRGSDDRSEGGKSCSHCKATSTPLWRRDPSTMKPLCNACGLYLQQRNKLRPQELIDADDDGNTSEESDVNYVGPECSHCRTHHTSVWRRSKSGEQLCNACGVYARLRGKPRPLSLKKNKIRPRSKHSK